MKTAMKLTFAAVIAALSLSAIPSWADNGHWKHERGWHDRGWHDRGWHRRHFDDVLVIREPRYVYREPAYVYREPVYVYRPHRPAVVIGVDIPPLVIPF
jgi:hypothetical protein